MIVTGDIVVVLLKNVSGVTAAFSNEIMAPLAALAEARQASRHGKAALRTRDVMGMRFMFQNLGGHVSSCQINYQKKFIEFYQIRYVISKSSAFLFNDIPVIPLIKSP